MLRKQRESPGQSQAPAKEVWTTAEHQGSMGRGCRLRDYRDQHLRTNMVLVILGPMKPELCGFYPLLASPLWLLKKGRPDATFWALQEREVWSIILGFFILLFCGQCSVHQRFFFAFWDFFGPTKRSIFVNVPWILERISVYFLQLYFSISPCDQSIVGLSKCLCQRSYFTQNTVSVQQLWKSSNVFVSWPTHLWGHVCPRNV